LLALACRLARFLPYAPLQPLPAATGTAAPASLDTPRPLRLTATSPGRLLGAGQHSCCRHCGNRIDLYPIPTKRPIALHPAERTATQVPESCRWYLSGGIAHPQGDGSAWCRILHVVLCPRTPPPAG